MRLCCHCGAGKSPCWRRGPPEKPLLCNACGAHFLVKKSLDGYMPGQRSSSSTPSSTSQQIQQVSSHRQWHRHMRQSLTPDPEAGPSTSSSLLAASSAEQDGLEVEQPAVVSNRKRSRLVACSAYEVDPYTASVLRCKRTFETADGVVITVVRRMRKQLKPRASCSS